MSAQPSTAELLPPCILAGINTAVPCKNGSTLLVENAVLQGCLSPVTITIPAGCLLSPSDEAAVVGGNVLTSQRVTDVIFKAFKAAAASQVGGCHAQVAAKSCKISLDLSALAGVRSSAGCKHALAMHMTWQHFLTSILGM